MTKRKQLACVNQWEHLGWLVDGKQVDPTTIVEVFIKKKPFSVIWREKTVPCYDTGHTYYSTSTHGFVKDPFFNMEIPLEALVEKFKVTV